MRSAPRWFGADSAHGLGGEREESDEAGAGGLKLRGVRFRACAQKTFRADPYARARLPPRDFSAAFAANAAPFPSPPKAGDSFIPSIPVCIALHAN